MNAGRIILAAIFLVMVCLQINGQPLTLQPELDYTSAVKPFETYENPNPYAIFGVDVPVFDGNILLEEDDRYDEIFVFVIENFEEGSEIARMEHNPQTGQVKFFDESGEIIGEALLAKYEYAWPTLDPMSQMYLSVSPYSFSNNNPIRYIDPNGMYWYSYDEEYQDEDGNIQTRTQYAYHKERLSRDERREAGYKKNIGLVAVRGGEYLSLEGGRVNTDYQFATMTTMLSDFASMGYRDARQHMSVAGDVLGGTNFNENTMPLELNIYDNTFVISTSSNSYINLESKELKHSFNEYHLATRKNPLIQNPLHAPRLSGDAMMVFEFFVMNAYSPPGFPPHLPSQSTKTKTDRQNKEYKMRHYRQAGLIR